MTEVNDRTSFCERCNLNSAPNYYVKLPSCDCKIKLQVCVDCATDHVFSAIKEGTGPPYLCLCRGAFSFYVRMTTGHIIG